MSWLNWLNWSAETRKRLSLAKDNVFWWLIGVVGGTAWILASAVVLILSVVDSSAWLALIGAVLGAVGSSWIVVVAYWLTEDESHWT